MNMVSPFALSASIDQSSAPDTEVDLVNQFLDILMVEGDPSVARISAVNFYVAMKSKPLIILTDDSQGDKTSIVDALARVLLGENNLQFQLLDGNSEWGRIRGRNKSVLSMAYTRFVTEKILAIMDEASQFENLEHVYIVCISQINPADLSGFFTEIAHQLSHGNIMCVGDAHFIKPVHYPDNLWLIGTMDEQQVTFEDDLFSQAMIFQSSAVNGSHSITLSKDAQERFQATFLRSRLRSQHAAYRKLQTILSKDESSLEPILKVVLCLSKNSLSVTSSVLDHCVIFLANAFSIRGQGLFDPITSRNLEIASDFVIEQILLTRFKDKIRSSQSLRLEMHDLLRTFPRSQAFLGAL